MAQGSTDTIFDPVETGAAMREARQSIGRSLSEIAQELRIRQSYLEAIEEGRLSDLPGPAYTSGFLRTYGDYLKLDGARIALQYKTTGGMTDQHTSLSMPAPMEEGRAPTGSIMLIAGVMAILAYSVWYYISSAPGPGDNTESEIVAEQVGGDEPAAADTKTPETDATQAARNTNQGPAAPAKSPPEKSDQAPPAAEKPKAEKPAPAPRKIAAKPPKVAGPSPITRGRRANTVTDDAVRTAEAETRIRVPKNAPRVAVPVTRAAPAAPTPAAPTPAAAATPQAAGGPATAARPRNVQTASLPEGPLTIVLRAKSDSWVEIRKGREQPVLSRLMRAGETFEVPHHTGYSINTGNAGAIEVLVNGRVVPPIGRQGEVSRDFVLDARRLLGGSRAPR